MASLAILAYARTAWQQLSIVRGKAWIWTAIGTLADSKALWVVNLCVCKPKTPDCRPFPAGAT